MHLSKKVILRPNILVLIFVCGFLLGLEALSERQEKNRPKLNIPHEGLEKRKPPKELKLTSILYELAISPNREDFATKHDIPLQEGKVRVFISLDTASAIPERKNLVKSYNIEVEKKSNDLLRALVSIDELIPLSKEPIIWSIRLPDKPVEP